MIEYVSAADLVPADYNPRAISPAAQAKLRRGIETFGLVDPIIARRSDRVIVGGHQRHRIATDLGLATVPVVFLDDLSDADLRALMVFLNNQEAQGEWDSVALAELLGTLHIDGYDLTLTGFESQRITELLAAPAVPHGNGSGSFAAPVAFKEDEASKILADQWICVVMCGNERELAALYEELTARGMECKLVT